MEECAGILRSERRQRVWTFHDVSLAPKGHDCEEDNEHTIGPAPLGWDLIHRTNAMRKNRPYDIATLFG